MTAAYTLDVATMAAALPAERRPIVTAHHLYRSAAKDVDGVVRLAKFLGLNMCSCGTCRPALILAIAEATK